MIEGQHAKHKVFARVELGKRGLDALLSCVDVAVCCLNISHIQHLVQEKIQACLPPHPLVYLWYLHISISENKSHN